MMKIGIDMGGMSIKIGLVNNDYEIISRLTIPTRLDVEAAEVIADMANAVTELLNKENIKLSQCQGIGMGIPGIIDDVNGVINYSNNFEWRQIKIVEEFKKYFNTKIKIANDADAAALGEVCAGAAEGAENAVLLTLGTGVGSGVILNRNIFRGALVGGCEFGHMVIKEDGELCTCGRRGCLEAYASATALIRIAKKHATQNPESIMNEMCEGDLHQMNGKIPFDAAQQLDETGIKVVREYEGYLACGIANVINIFRPQKIILGGGVAAQKETLIKPLQILVEQMCFGGEAGTIPQIVTSRLGNDAGIIGAANLLA